MSDFIVEFGMSNTSTSSGSSWVERIFVPGVDSEYEAVNQAKNELNDKFKDSATIWGGTRVGGYSTHEITKPFNINDIHRYDFWDKYDEEDE